MDSFRTVEGDAGLFQSEWLQFFDDGWSQERAVGDELEAEFYPFSFGDAFQPFCHGDDKLSAKQRFAAVKGYVQQFSVFGKVLFDEIYDMPGSLGAHVMLALPASLETVCAGKIAVQVHGDDDGQLGVDLVEFIDILQQLLLLFFMVRDKEAEVCEGLYFLCAKLSIFDIGEDGFVDKNCGCPFGRKENDRIGIVDYQDK